MDSAQHEPSPDGRSSTSPSGRTSIDPSHEWVADDFNHPSLPHHGGAPHEDTALVPAAEPFEDWAGDSRATPRA